MKKFLSVLVAACVMAVCTQPAFAISKAEITNVNPNDNSATYLGDGLYLIDNGNDDGEYREGKNSTIVDAAAFSKVKTIAVAPLLYSPNKNDPSWKEAMDTVLAASNEFNKNGDIIVVSYDDVADKILRTTGQDILSMNRRQATKVFKKYISAYADAYVEFTISVGSTRGTDIFAEVNKSGTDNRLYAYKASVGSRTIEAYANASKNSFKNIENGKKEAEKQAAKVGGGIVWDMNK